MDFIEEYKTRGFFHQCTNLAALADISKHQQIVAYIGFDQTAKSLHVGNLMQIMVLRLLQKHGHKPIILVGGATTKIGDPTGKEAMRKMLSDQDVADNIAGIKKCLSKFFKFGDGPSDAIMLNNADWLLDLNYIDFLRDYGKHFSINRMLTMDSVKLRLEREQNLTFLEFNYMLLQAYDFMHLNRKYGCNLQIGGSDQWGNIVQGIELTRRTDGEEVFGLTTPLLTTSSGAKMGKSENGAVWLSEDLLSPYGYFQYWRNMEDLDIERFGRFYTEIREDELAEIYNMVNINEAKKRLAFEITKLCHGEEAAGEALRTAQEVFEQGGAAGLPEFKADAAKLAAGESAFELFFIAELAESKSAARKLIRGGGAKLNDNKIDDENLIISLQDMAEKDYIKLSAGKKRHILIKTA